MLSVKSIYKIGKGPSSSHSMGPANAAKHFLKELQSTPSRIKVVLHGSLAATGRGHLTDQTVKDVLHSIDVDFQWSPESTNLKHPNTIDFIAYDNGEEISHSHRFYSVGGGQLHDDSGTIAENQPQSYDCMSFREILEYCGTNDLAIWQYVGEFDSAEIWEYLGIVWQAMRKSVEQGTELTGVLPGGLKLQRRARKMLEFANSKVGSIRDRNLLSAYALAVAEENASGQTIVTAPTCGSAGVLPAILYFFHKHYDVQLEELTRALAISGLAGSAVAEMASISGAEVGCQGEIGTACAMAAAAATYLLNGSNSQIEYAAEMGLEHFLGLTCDPINGLVQIPCIERNAFAAMRAMDCASFALATDGEHFVSLDDVINVMNKTGRDLQSKYRETAEGGLAALVKARI